MSLNTISAGTTADQALLDRYESAHAKNLIAKNDAEKYEGFDGFVRKVFAGGGSGATLGSVGALVAVSLSTMPGTIMNNPVMAGIVVAGAVIGAAAGYLALEKHGQNEKDWHTKTSAYVEAVETQVAARPDLAERLLARREAATVKVDAELEAQRSNSNDRMIVSTSLGMGVMRGR